MQLIDYIYDNRCVSKYMDLIRDVYREYTLFAERKVEEVRRMFSKGNPFLRYGSWRNYLVTDQGKTVAHISGILDRRLPSDVGLVGYFDAVKNPECVNEAFDAAIGYLAKKRKKVVRGPVNFTTWQSFRVSYPETNQPFILEPFTRSYYRNFFEEYGFKTAQENISTIVKIGQSGFSAYETPYNNLRKGGFIFEAVNGKNLSRFLPEVYDLVVKIFDDSWSFVKISYEEFLYNLRDSAAASSFLLLTRNKKKNAVAFLLGTLDVHSSVGNRTVLKTMGVLPEYQKLGIARALFYLVYLKAKQENTAELIFSTMRVDNKKIRELTSSKHDIYRRYSVYEMAI